MVLYVMVCYVTIISFTFINTFIGGLFLSLNVFNKKLYIIYEFSCFFNQLEIEEKSYLITMSILRKIWNNQLMDTHSNLYIKMKNEVESQVVKLLLTAYFYSDRLFRSPQYWDWGSCRNAILLKKRVWKQ